ncbi:MAG TPA: 16S rRNA (adenine(1518)-N(6)/adenine(1519)-N(6))-dimethyltransferase RsmA [Victivallales bacterium]|nr:16S rRNA (adenine(1518)-N(6)/adenine(1519)-N(6))-dimethyltransferase RsmA [Victivallales bacterium]HRR06182.1 16S rRNA (adenine(1518)-N(6)/adenine(1519)-N(6))-dimethyltransferase RsmA [Victivallales bacterium]HRR28521.1 16S rRNA (adenine(1518)-N(6)/adenine(1519)-N(6))-dimethyltransferase RsmA [Victivallales bacterium]HRU01090.1 16S rRNA (adenine(1518)-N(6)/adenine(1519)-N(6))-dimethyltransferase RsmA [Victivallales bacterium]
MQKDIRSLIEKLKIKPGKSLGQNFMVDENFLNFIIREASPKKNETVVEIGPGFGALTFKLLERVNKLISIEMDLKLFSYLRENISNPKLILLHSDAMKVNFRELIPNCDFRIISNMPYSISTPFILKLIQENTLPYSMYLVLQEEVSDRFFSCPKSKNYGASSVLIQSFFSGKKIRKIPGEVFFPRPEVSSAFTYFSRKEWLSDINVSHYFAIVKAAFSMRRKTLFNNWSKIFPQQKISYIFEKFKLKKNIRAEELSPDNYLEIAKIAEKL